MVHGARKSVSGWMDWRSFWSLVATSVSKRIRLDSIGRGNRGKKKVAGRKVRGGRTEGGRESSKLPVVGRYVQHLRVSQTTDEENVKVAFFGPVCKPGGWLASPESNAWPFIPGNLLTAGKTRRSIPFPPLVSQPSRGRRARSTLPLWIVTLQPTDHLTDPILFNRRLKLPSNDRYCFAKRFYAIKS